MQNDIAIKAEHVSKSFLIPSENKSSIRSYFVNPFHKTTKKRFNALKDISLEVKKGEFLGVIGRNGSGKSTLLKILAGIYLPDNGGIITHGKIIPFLELGVGFNPELSGRENILLNGTILGMKRKYLEKKFDEIVDFAEVREFIDLQLKNYSSGMQVRLAFAISIMADGDIYLMDEVLAVGDTNFQGRCIEIFNKYKDMGKTVILVTHDTGTVERYCDKAILLREGKVQSKGGPQKVATEYMNENMSDEEKRLQDKSGDDSVQRNHLKKKVEIKKVQFLDEKGNERKVFKTGDTITIRVNFKKNDKSIHDLNFGLALFNQENNYILGINTIIDKINTVQYNRQGYVEVRYNNIPLKTNTYHFKVAILGKNDLINYDFLNRSDEFKVVSVNFNQGQIELDYQWVK